MSKRKEERKHIVIEYDSSPGFFVWEADENMRPVMGINQCSTKLMLLFEVLMKMLPPEKSGFIRIIKTPAGKPPEEVRQKWVGLILPFIKRSVAASKELITGKPMEEKERFLVPQSIALSILKRKSPSAAEWFEIHGYPKEKRNFYFEIDEAEIILSLSQV